MNGSTPLLHPNTRLSDKSFYRFLKPSSATSICAFVIQPQQNGCCKNTKSISRPEWAAGKQSDLGVTLTAGNVHASKQLFPVDKHTLVFGYVLS